MEEHFDQKNKIDEKLVRIKTKMFMSEVKSMK